MKKYIYGVYDMKDSEVCMGEFESVKELAKYFDTSVNTIDCALCRKNKIKARYLIVKIYI